MAVKRPQNRRPIMHATVDGGGKFGLRRGLQERSSDGNTTLGGTMGVLFIVCALYIILWVARCLKRRCDRQSRSAAQTRNPGRLVGGDDLGVNADVEMALMEYSLRSMMANMTTLMENYRTGGALGSLPESRRETIKKLLITKKVIVASEETDDDSNDVPPSEQPQDDPKGDLVITPRLAVENDGENVATGELDYEQEHCAICLIEYEEGDAICWSRNESCTHAFHQSCIIEWLLSHEECPCCRHNYLSFSEESEIEMTEIEREEHRRNVSILRTPTATVTAAAGDDEAQLLRGLQLIYQYSREPMLPSSSSLLPAPPPVIGNGENIGDNDNGHEDAASVHGGSDIRADAAEDDADGHADLETGAISVVAELVPVEESYSAEPDSRDRSEPANVTIGAEEEE